MRAALIDFGTWPSGQLQDHRRVTTPGRAGRVAQLSPDPMAGARGRSVDLSACPSREPLRGRRAGRGRCRCGDCAVCGYPMHSGVHGPLLDQPPGSPPFGHEYVPPTDDEPEAA